MPIAENFAVSGSDRIRAQIDGDIITLYTITTGGTPRKTIGFEHQRDAGTIELGFDAILQYIATAEFPGLSVPLQQILRIV